MDIVSAIAVLSPFPVEIDQDRLYFAGAFHPQCISAQILNKEQRRLVLQQTPTRNPESSIMLALRFDDEELAWSLLNQLSFKFVPSPDLDLRIKAWSAKQLAALKLNAEGPNIRLALSTSHNQKLRRKVQRAETSVRSMLSSLPWPMWFGPLVIHESEQAAIISRPITPLIQLPEKQLNEEEISKALCRIALERYQQGQSALPEWLMTGLGEVAVHKTLGTGPSPKRMLKIRSAAGLQNIRDLCVNNAIVDPKLACAVCAPLVHTRNKHKLASFIALINNKVDAESAFKIAYGRDFKSLIENP